MEYYKARFASLFRFSSFYSFRAGEIFHRNLYELTAMYRCIDYPRYYAYVRSVQVHPDPRINRASVIRVRVYIFHLCLSCHAIMCAVISLLNC